MVLLGYESGIKGYRLLDPTIERLHISRDVVFEEAVAWDWSANSSGTGIEPETFTVEFQRTVAHPTTNTSADSMAGDSS